MHSYTGQSFIFYQFHFKKFAEWTRFYICYLLMKNRILSTAIHLHQLHWLYFPLMSHDPHSELTFFGLQYVLKTSSRRVLKTSWRRLQRNNFLHHLARRLEDVLEDGKVVTLKKCSRHVLKMLWRPTKCLLGRNIYLNLTNLNLHLKNLYLANLYLTNLRQIQSKYTMY